MSFVLSSFTLTDYLPSDSITFVEGHNGSDLPVFRENGYMIGRMDDVPYVLYTEKVNQDNVFGKYYLIDYQKDCFTPHPFQLLREDDGQYRLVTQNIDSRVSLSLSVDPVSFSGTFTTTDNPATEHRVAFKEYAAPKYEEYASFRYLKPIFSYTKIPDVLYGKATGYWTSYPMDHDSRIGKMLFTLMPKTAKPTEQDLLMDLYLPQDDSLAKRPLMVLLHGGSFYFSDKGDHAIRTACEHYAQLGYVVASVNYRMGFKFKKMSIQQCGYQAVQDAHAALRFLVANADKYHIDPNFVFMAGSSAGSIIALSVAFMNDQNCPHFVTENNLVEQCGLLHTSGNEYRNEVNIKALANLWGAVYDLHELDGHNIPVISFHGTDDKIVPFNYGYPFSNYKRIGEDLFDVMYGSQAIHEYLDSLHVRNELHPLEGCDHAPHEGKDGTLNHHYYYILDHTERFFYSELETQPKLQNDEHNPTLYHLEGPDISRLSWQIEGGVILESKDRQVRVIWFDDAQNHTLRASGINVIGTPFRQEWQITKRCS